jgi:hypothetical protein
MRRLDVIEHLVKNAESGMYRGERAQRILVKRLRLTLNGEYDRVSHISQVFAQLVEPEPPREATDQPFHPAVRLSEDTEPFRESDIPF